MLNHGSQDIQAEAFVEWINTCPNISHPCNHITELSNGILLFEVLAEIDSQWFKLIRSADIGENWVLKINNLKKMYRMISRYYEENLGIPFDRLPQVVLQEIAKDSNVEEIFKLCQLVLFITVARENNEMIVERLQKLTEQSQRVVMLHIEEINRIRMSASNQSHLQPTTSSSTNPTGTGDYTPHSSVAEDASYRNQSDLNRLAIEKEELEASQRKLIEEHASLQFKYDELESEKEDLQLRLQEMDRAVTQANETGRHDFVMRTEIEHLKQDLQKSEDRRQEAEIFLERQTETIQELTRKGEEMQRKVDQASRLKDQLDEYRHAAEKLQKAENVIEKFKKKMEENSDLKRQNKLLDDQNHSLMERNQQIETEYRKVLAFKTLMDSYKDQVATLETKNNELLREKNRMEYDIQQMTQKIELLEADKARDSDRILALEEHIQDVQLGVNKSSVSREIEGDDDGDIDMDLNMDDLNEDSFKEPNVTELKKSNRRLERQLRTLQEESYSPDKNQKALVLQHLLDDANRLKSQFEKNYLDVSQERDILQSDMAHIREGIPDALVKENKDTMALKLHIVDLKKESKQLRESIAKLEQKVSDGHFDGLSNSNIDKLDDANLGTFKAQYKDMEKKSSTLEEQNNLQLQNINKLLLEKEMLLSQAIDQKDTLLEKERLISEMKATLATFEAKDDEPIKQQNALLQQQTMEQQGQIHDLQLKLKRAKNLVMQQDKLVRESSKQQPVDGNGNYDEAVVSLRQQVSMRDEEVERLKKQLYEVRLQARREQQLMMSAWYDIARHTRRELVSPKAYPTSWLAQQRTKH
ncbi:unnamed protein product [Cunninghamella blakesleeana]